MARYYDWSIYSKNLSWWCKSQGDEPPEFGVGDANANYPQDFETNTTTTTTVLQPFFRDHPGEPVPEENF